jgi:hypothetical protein
VSYHPSYKEDGLGAASLPCRVLDLNVSNLGRDIKLVETPCERSGLDGHGGSFTNPQVVFQVDGLGNKKGDLLKQWHEIVHSYIQPFLTFDSDRFPALSSLAETTQI